MEFAVVGATLTHTAKNGNITVTADPLDQNSAVIHAEFRKAGDGVASMSAFLPLTDKEKQTGCFTREIPSDAENYKVYFENRYGIWTHPMTKI